MLIGDEDFAQEIHAHLQSLKLDERCAEAIVRFLDNPEMLARLGQKKTITIPTGQLWLQKMGYQWDYNPKGQYSDSHEREDVVDYQQKIYLLALAELALRITRWNSKDGIHEDPPPGVCRVVMWYHDESTFYANDRQRKHWVHKDEKAVPYAKGKGASLMPTDFFSAEYGWLWLRDGKRSV